MACVKRLGLWVLAIALGALGQAQAEPRVAEVLATIKDPATRSYIAGLADGISWSSVEANARTGRDIFCPPGTLAITEDQYVSIFTRYAESRQIGTHFAGETMVRALIDAFPCSKAPR
jgi:hypothetical protein